jgi:hypothetical protein
MQKVLLKRIKKSNIFETKRRGQVIEKRWSMMRFKWMTFW